VGRNIRKHILLKSVLNSNYNAIKPSRNNEVFTIETISDNCFLVKITTQDNKVLIYKQNSTISVFEAPINPIVSNQLIDYLGECFPDTPVKYCFLTHHHPDHAGGVKSFKEIDAVVVTSAGDVDYITQLANYPF
jgi:glyoxylase-like metal-dependent hydrolase (beta-lactamase superfamily II)